MNGIGKAMEMASACNKSSRAIVLYGSYARGDYDSNSDIDLLLVADSRGFRKQFDEKISVHTYDIKDLRLQAAQGSLFILHLLQEGVVLKDCADILGDLTRHFCRPESYLAEAQRALMKASSLLDVDEELFVLHREAFAAIVKYICRTLVYAKFADCGAFSFSLRALAAEDGFARLILEMENVCLSFSDFQYIRDCAWRLLGRMELPSCVSSLRRLIELGRGDAMFNGLARRLISGRGQQIYGISALSGFETLEMSPSLSP